MSEYDYIRECVRLEKDVTLCLHEGKDKTLSRTERDDARDSHLTLDDLLPTQGAAPQLSFDNLSILLGECTSIVPVCPPLFCLFDLYQIYISIWETEAFYTNTVKDTRNHNRFNCVLLKKSCKNVCYSQKD